MKLQFDDHFKTFSQYLDNALARPSYYPSVEALMEDLLAKEVTHGDVLEQGISSPLVALAHLVNNPHLLDGSSRGQGLCAALPSKGAEVSIEMLIRSAREAVHMAPIQAVPVAAVKILGKVMEQGNLAPAQQSLGSVLVGVLDRSQHMELAHQKEIQGAVRDAFASYRKTFPLDAEAERLLARHMHSETATKLVTLLKFDPDNVRALTQKERAALKQNEPGLS